MPFAPRCLRPRGLNASLRGVFSFRMGMFLPITANYGGAWVYDCSSCCYSKRCFWNFFSTRGGGNEAAAQTANAVQHQSIVDKAHRDASLHNERLLDACLDLLALCRGEGTDRGSTDAVTAVVEATLHDVRKTPSEQFDLVYAALCLPIATTNRQVYRCLMVVLEAFLPEVLFRIFESEDLIVVGPDGASRRSALLRFVHALLGQANVPDGVENEEVVLVYLDDVSALFPSLRRNPAFLELEANATCIAMKARLFALLSQLCAEFDTAGTGKVDLAELQATSQRVLGEVKARMLLDGAQPDKDGKIRYTQLTSLLTRPPPRPK
ncbi:hypothetical protein TraAM80_03257 [Trypanosoma rangeli]|uniref:EF-hand domain-containing protein n=1 Tax=Trypanosoma rangeli TaxID=5698 RepID=A0A422NQ90_TRYRA|nr:uncharacterized protein TraAM80_03257 [Trypanosoma rangeli]RNF07574.1 hypothetical protein TraAM80_03257 [Trypanosoma rangeli]|eukprot:RNF07574.1 hypothetical protein TraAM80_03257 [Trypanosoma rangeli]